MLNKMKFARTTQILHLMPVELGFVYFLYRARLEFVDQPINNENTKSFIHLQSSSETVLSWSGS